MEKKEYISRQEAYDSILYGMVMTGYQSRALDCISEFEIPSADVVPWSWLEQYATGKRCNFASGFVSEARKEWEAKNG